VDRPAPSAQAAAARGTGPGRRRRGLYGPPPRLTSTSPLVGRLVWHIGDWGRASEHIGGRWEAVAGQLARKRLEPGDQLVVLGAAPELMAAVLTSGLAHADALRAWQEDGHLALEPLDFKWSLETASARQVSGETLTRLLETELPLLNAELVRVRLQLGLPTDAEIELHDGRFIAPEHPANRAALRDDPRLPSLLLPVDPQAFFRPLSGWPAAAALARLEGCDLERLRALDAVERYYRLGAGAAGALTRLHTGLFDAEPTTVDAPALIARYARPVRQGAINALLLDLEQRLAARKVLEERLSQLPRTAYPFGKLRSDLARAGAPRAVLDSRGALGRAYGEVMREVSAAIREAGYAMTAAGLAPEAALDRLAADAERWAALAHEQARQVAERLRAASTTT
jgi:hypothetical protein